MLPVILMFIQFLLTNANPLVVGKECTVSIEYKSGDLKEPQPLILQRNASKPTILYPTNRKGILRIPAGQSIYLACPGQGNLLKNVGSSEATAICMTNKMFRIEGKVVEFSSLVCKYLPRHESRRVNSTVCLGRYKPIEIGFPLKGYFLSILEICRDDKTFVTHYSKFQLSKAIGSFQTPYPRPSMWVTGTHFPNLDVHYLYTFNSQLNMFAKILNSTKLVDKYLNRNRQSITRGHLTAKSDFVYGSLQAATFWYLNAAPQWMTFNSGNWQILESSVQRYADRNQYDLDVYTGVHGQMTLPNARGTPTPMYLYAEGEIRALPVPKFYWKVVYHPKTRLGTAFVGVNDPFLVSNTTDIFLCTDISYQINWINWSPNKTKGVSYACTVDDLRRKVPAVPKLNVTGILN